MTDFERHILRSRPYCQLPMCCNESAVVLDPHKPEMLAVCREHADMDKSNETISPESSDDGYAQYLDEQRNREAYEWDQLLAEEHAQRLLKEETDQ